MLTFEDTLHRICIFELLWRKLLEIYCEFYCISVSLLEHWKSFYSRSAGRMIGDCLPLCLFQKCGLNVKWHSIFSVYQQGKGIVFTRVAGCCSWRVTCVMISFSVPRNTHFTFCQNVVYKAINVLWFLKVLWLIFPWQSSGFWHCWTL